MCCARRGCGGRAVLGRSSPTTVSGAPRWTRANRCRCTRSVSLVALYLLLPFGVLLVLGVPIAFSLILACGLFLTASGTRIPPIMLANDMFGAVDSVSLLA